MAINMKKSIFKNIIFTLIMLLIIITPKIELANNETEVSLGDINHDKTIDSKDLLLMLRHVYSSENGKKQEWVLTGNNFLAGDITKNGRIDSSDIIAILRHIATSESEEIASKHKDWIINEAINENIIECLKEYKKKLKQLVFG